MDQRPDFRRLQYYIASCGRFPMAAYYGLPQPRTKGILARHGVLCRHFKLHRWDDERSLYHLWLLYRPVSVGFHGLHVLGFDQTPDL